ncbi:GAF domain-containing protein [Balneola sp. MJW-20]|uniref:GAF domain-containing protein n=1 Tax=Gracilimonas aurantiaca TaxID=3234185 RepID=UPI003465500A
MSKKDPTDHEPVDIKALLKQREAELSVINSLQHGLASRREMQEIYDEVGDRIQELFDAQIVGINTFDHKEGLEHFRYAYEEGEVIQLDPLPIDTLRRTIIESAETIWIKNNLPGRWKEITGEAAKAVPGTKMAKTAVYVPMIVQKKVIGYVTLQNVDRENAYSESDVSFLETLANSMSIALENAKLFSESDQRNAELALLSSVQQGLAGEMSLQDIYGMVGDRLQDMFDAQIVGINTFDLEADLEYFNYAYEEGEVIELDPLPIDTLRRKIIDTAEMIWIQEDLPGKWEELTGEPAKAVPGTKMAKTAIYMPLLVNNNVIGYITLQNVDRENAYTESDVRLLKTLTNSMSIALQNAKLFNETEQRNAELAVINSVQEGLVAEMDMQGIYDLVGDKIRDIFDAQVVGITTFDMELKLEYFQYLYEDGKRIYPAPRPLDKVRQKLIDTRQLLLINENLIEEVGKITGSEVKAVPGTELPKSLLMVPMILGDDVKGYLDLQNLDREQAFSESDVRLLTTLTNSLSVALNNARLFNETEQRNAELAVINSVQQGLVAEMDMQGIYDLVGDRIRDLFDSQVTMIATFDHDSDLETFRYVFEDGERIFPSPRPIDGFRKYMISNRDLIDIEENASEEISRIMGIKPQSIPGTEFPKSIVFLPLVIGDNVKGYVSLQNLDKEFAFSESDIRLLKTLASSMSVALENARLFSETEQRNAELAVINSVQQGLVAEMDMEGIYNLVGDRIRDLFDAQVAAIATFDHDNKTETFHYLYENGERMEPAPRPYDQIRQKLIDTQKLIDIEEKTAEFYSEITGKPPEAVPGTGFPLSMVFVPLVISDSVKGYVTLQNLDKEFAFTESDVRLLKTLANSMSVALENARLFNETEQRNAELAVINSVQQGLVAEMDIQGIYVLVGDKIRDIFDAQIVGINTFDSNYEYEYFNYAFEDGEVIELPPRPLDAMRKKIVETADTIWIKDDLPGNWEKITGEVTAPVPGTRDAKTVIYVPMIINDRVRGYITLQHLDRENVYTDSDVRLLKTLVNSMSIALNNARLFSETEQRNAELAVINSVQQGLVAEMDMQGIYDLVGNKIQEMFDAQIVGINTIDLDQGIEHFKYAYEDGEVIQLDPRPLDAMRNAIIESKDLIWIKDNLPREWKKLTGEEINAVPGTKPPKTVVFVPMIVNDSVRGYVTLQHVDKENVYTDSDVRLLKTLVNSMSVALENARLFNETEQRNAELAVINSVQQGLVAEMDMKGIYDLVGNRIQELFDAQVVGINTVDLEQNMEYFHYAYEDGEVIQIDPQPLDKIRRMMVDQKKLIHINDNLADRVEEISGERPKAVPGTEFPKSVVFVPMTVGDTVRGYVTLQNLDHEYAFSESDVRLLNTLVNSMTVALENARLFNETSRLLAETEQRNAELAVINSVQEGLVREMDMENIYSLVGDRICKVLNTQALLIRTFDHKKGLETWEYAIENDQRLYSEPRPFIWANRYLIKNKKSILINENYLETAKKYGDKESGVSKGLPPKSAIFVPMMLGDEVIGSVSLQNVERENAFTKSDVRLLKTLTNSMSVAIENARLFNETEQRASEMQTVNSISKALVSQLEFDSLVQLIGDQMKDTFKADIVYLAYHERKTNMLHFPYMYGEKAESRPFGNGITEKIITNKEPLLVNHGLDQASKKLKAELIGQDVQSYLGVPILAGKKAIGVISVQSTEDENRFDDNDLRLLSTIAANVGVAIQNAEAYQNLQSALNELRSAQEQLVQQEKLASLGQLTAGIAHEIKNPLNFVNNFSDLSIELVNEIKEELENITPDNTDDIIDEVNHILADVEMNLKKIHEHGTRADGIVKSMLQHSRGGSGKTEPNDLNQIVKEYVNLAFHGMRASKNPINVDIDLNLGKDIGQYPLIVEDFSRVILNLCNNAFDAMREKLNKANGTPYKPKLRVSTFKKDACVCIEIEDNGPGIPEKIKAQVLQPFFTTKKGTEGTGLGLSITNDIVKAHGGTLNLESTHGEKTTFTIQLSR